MIYPPRTPLAHLSLLSRAEKVQSSRWIASSCHRGQRPCPVATATTITVSYNSKSNVGRSCVRCPTLPWPRRSGMIRPALSTASLLRLISSNAVAFTAVRYDSNRASEPSVGDSGSWDQEVLQLPPRPIPFAIENQNAWIEWYQSDEAAMYQNIWCTSAARRQGNDTDNGSLNKSYNPLLLQPLHHLALDNATRFLIELLDDMSRGVRKGRSDWPTTLRCNRVRNRKLYE